MVSQAEQRETVDVVIAGCGPTGAMLSGYLGKLGIRNVVLEREPDITTDPRAIALDEDGIRFLQGLGVYDSIYTDIGTCMNKFMFIGGTEKVLEKKPFTEYDYKTTEGGTGHVGFICQKQPVLEKHLRKVMAASDLCDLRLQCTVKELSEDEEWTVCRYTDATGAEHQIRSRFFVGADGKTGYTRKQYLEPRGIKLERAHNMFYEETWVALNLKLTLPTPTSHPDFPLWRLGYTPEQVYDVFFPADFRFICNPDRPSVCGRFGLPTDRLWRFEYLVLKGEDGQEMAALENMKKVVFPYITHAGRRYGLSGDIPYPEDCITVLRSRPFMFSARSCNRWAQGRVVLCGDAAHVFPPFGAQGIASGFRDAASLAWRLALVCRAPPRSLESSERILTAWYRERKQQLERSLAATIQNGEFVNETNRLKLLIRSCFFWVMSLMPGWRERMRLGQRVEGMVRYRYEAGMPFLPELGGGVCLPQVYCKPLVRHDEEDGEDGVGFTDDVIFTARKRGLFQILVYLRSLDELPAASSALRDIGDVSKGEFDASEVTFLVENVAAGLPPSLAKVGDLSSVYQLAEGEEFARSPLCIGRPAPRFYDPYRLRKEIRGKRFIIVRPDRFVFAACDSKEQLDGAIAKAVAYFRQ